MKYDRDKVKALVTKTMTRLQSQRAQVEKILRAAQEDYSRFSVSILMELKADVRLSYQNGKFLLYINDVEYLSKASVFDSQRLMSYLSDGQRKKVEQKLKIFRELDKVIPRWMNINFDYHKPQTLGFEGYVSTNDVTLFLVEQEIPEDFKIKPVFELLWAWLLDNEIIKVIDPGKLIPIGLK